jgi:AraC-like DNA-binding protein
VFDLSSIYQPMTARPFERSGSYAEYRPCEALRPFVACFWGSEAAQPAEPNTGEGTLVIPDTCMDIIFEINPAADEISSGFYGINDKPFVAGSSAQPSQVLSFGIRFYFWAVHLFAGEDLSGVCNAAVDVDAAFCGWKKPLESMLLRTRTMPERIRMTEQFLLGKLNLGRGNTDILNAAHCILSSRGTEPIRNVCAYTSVGQRQLERYFLKHIGISIKKAASLVRYQNVWHDVVYAPVFRVQAAIEKYGYADQSHLLNEFSKYHGLTPAQAKKAAVKLP